MRTHMVMVPFPAQGHLTPMLNLAKLLHSRGFLITFVVTDFTYRRLLLSLGPESAGAGLDDFRFEPIPDGLPPPDADTTTQPISSLFVSIQTCLSGPFGELLRRLDGSADAPGVAAVVADGSMTFAVDVAEEMNIPTVLFHTHSGCGFLAYLNYPELVRKGYTPLKDESLLTNGYLDTPVDWIPGLTNIRLRDLPTFVRTTNPDDVMLKFLTRLTDYTRRATRIILNTFDDLEPDVVSSIRSWLPNLYTVGPLSPACRLGIPPDAPSSSIGSSLLKEDDRCLAWLDAQAEGSVMYVNFGSITTMTPRQVAEFARGLASSGHPFLWVVRPDLVSGSGDGKPGEGDLVDVEGRSMLARWCDQEAVLAHRAVGGFLTHCGWNSMLESMYEGVPMVCWPFFAEQHTNCRYACGEWGVGVDMEGEVRGERVAELVRDVMRTGRGEGVRRKAMEWKEKARRAIGTGGSSCDNIEKLVQDLAQFKRV